MIRVNLRTGQTIAFDILTDEGLASWQEHAANPSFQRSISGASITGDGWTHTLPIPPRFNRIELEARRLQCSDSVLGEILALVADDIIVSLTVYHSGVSRVDLNRREWKRRFRPEDKC